MMAVERRCRGLNVLIEILYVDREAQPDFHAQKNSGCVRGSREVSVASQA